MKNTKHPLTQLSTLACAGLALCLGGCDQSSKDTAREQASEMFADAGAALENAGESMSDAMGSAWSDLKDVGYGSRERVVSFLHDASDSIDEKLAQLGKGADQVGDASKAGYETALQEAKDARETLGEKITALSNASEDTWDETWSEVSQAWKQLRQKLSALE